MKERNLISNDTKIRERKSCPYCASLNIAKYRKLRGFYRCRACHSLFPKPELKKVKTYKDIIEISCPHCGGECQEYKEGEDFVTYWGEEVVERICNDCGKGFVIQEQVRRDWDVAKNIDDI